MKHLRFFDTLNVSPKLYIKSRENYTTNLGIIIGIISFVGCFGFSIFFIYQFFQKEDGNVIFNEIIDFDHKFNMTRIPFIFKLTNSKGISYSNKIVNFKFQHWILPQNTNGVPIINNIMYEKCSLNKHLLKSKYKNFFTNIDFESYYCLNINEYDLTIQGTFGDLNKGYSYINLYINECLVKSITNNNSNLNNGLNQCSDKSEILKKIGDLTLYLRIAYIDFRIDHTDYINPYKPYLKSDAIMFTYKSKSRVFYYFKNVFYNTDIGYFEKNIKMESSNIFDEYQITYPQVTFQVPEAFGLLSILISNKGNEFKKSYPKIQTLIANIGGVIKGITLIFEFILQYISTKSMFIYLSNFFINSYDFKKNQNKNIGVTRKSSLKYHSFYKINFYKNSRNFNNSNNKLNFSNEKINESKKILIRKKYENNIQKEIPNDKIDYQNNGTEPINTVFDNKTNKSLYKLQVIKSDNNNINDQNEYNQQENKQNDIDLDNQLEHQKNDIILHNRNRTE